MNRITLGRVLKIVAVLAVVGLGASACYGPPRFWLNHVGSSETEIVAQLGPAYYDSRKSPPTYHSATSPEYQPGTPHRLGWTHGLGMILAIDFDGSGVAVAQDRSSK